MKEVGLILGVVWIMYGRAVDWGMVVDDETRWKQIKKGKVLRWRERIKYSFTFPNIKLDRLLSISIHMMVCVMVWIAFGMDITSLYAALIFAVHPVSLSVATWLNGKRYGWNTLIVLIVYTLPLYTFPLLIFIPHFQANAFPTPLLFLGVDWRIFAGGVLCLGVFWRRFRGRWGSRKMGVVKDSTRWFGERWVLIIRTLSYYLINNLTGYKVGMFHDCLDGVFEDEWGSRTQEWLRVDREVVDGIQILIILLIIMVLGWGTRVGEGLWWWLIFTMVFSNWTTVTQSITDRYCYLSTIGLVVSVCAVMVYMRGEGALVAWGGWLAWRCVRGSRAYRGMKEFVDWHVDEMGESSRAVQMKVGYLLRVGDIREAKRWCSAGLSKWRWSTKLYMMGVSILSRTDYKEASELLINKDVDGLLEKIGG